MRHIPSLMLAALLIFSVDSASALSSDTKLASPEVQPAPATIPTGGGAPPTEEYFSQPSSPNRTAEAPEQTPEAASLVDSLLGLLPLLLTAIAALSALVLSFYLLVRSRGLVMHSDLQAALSQLQIKWGDLEREVAALRAEVDALKRGEGATRSPPYSTPRVVRQTLAQDDEIFLSASPAPGRDAGNVLRSIGAEYAAALGSPKSLREFGDRNDAINVSAGRLSGEGGAAFVWGIPMGGDMFALVPGYDLAIDFAVTYFSERSMPDDVRSAFELRKDGARALSLLQPGLGRAGPDGTVEVLRKGSLAGLSD